MSWNSYAPINSLSTLTPTFEYFDISAEEYAADSDEIETSGEDVVLVNRDVSTSLNLGAGDDYIAIGHDLKGSSPLSMGAGNDYTQQKAEYQEELKQRETYHAELAKREEAQQTEAKPASMLEKVSGAVALASLAAIVISALKVWGSGADY